MYYQNRIGSAVRDNLDREMLKTPGPGSYYKNRNKLKNYNNNLKKIFYSKKKL